jgi:uncharacterized heparinase superfamily protein
VSLRKLPQSPPFLEWQPEASRHMIATREFRFLSIGIRDTGYGIRDGQAGVRGSGLGTEDQVLGTRDLGAPAPDSRVSVPVSRNECPESRIPYPILWNDRRHPKLWLYHLNYCDFLNVRFSLPEEESALKAALEIALDWRRHNTQGSEVGWEPYPLSLRIVNWLKFLVRHAGDLEGNGGTSGRPGRLDGPDARATLHGNYLQMLLESLAQQTATLERRLEKDLLGNHLLKNIKALLFAGALLETAASGCWWDEGEELLAQELKEQILPDGGHFERSPMYHSQVLGDLLEIQVLCASAGKRLRCADLLSQKVRLMAQFLRGIVHYDGEIPLFNDSALGGARSSAELLVSASADEITRTECVPQVTLFPHTGYGVIRDDASRSHLVFDCGPLGPDYQPGHGHCDVLSFELSLHGQRVVVDTGVSTYECTPERLYERSTTAHNTVRIDGEDQAEIWASFRVGRRPRVGKLEEGTIGPFHFLRGEHFAYQHRGVVHARTIARRSDGAWIVADLLKGRGSHRVESFVHFHPMVRVDMLDGHAECGDTASRRRCTIAFAGRTYSFVTYGEGEFNLLESWYSEEFGKRQVSKVLRWAWTGNVPRMIVYTLVPEGTPAPAIAADAVSQSLDIDGHRILFS